MLDLVKELATNEKNHCPRPQQEVGTSTDDRLSNRLPGVPHRVQAATSSSRMRQVNCCLLLTQFFKAGGFSARV